MKTLTSTLLLSLAILVCCVPSRGQQTLRETIPANWKKVQPLKHLSFHLPKHAWDTERSGTDEIYKEYRVGKMAFTLIYEPRSRTAYDRREQKFGKGFEESIVEIGGKKSYLYTYAQIWRGRKRYIADLYVGDFPNGEVKLWVTADSWRHQDLEIAKQIFKTIEFIQP